jgi:hypothetical protein
MKRTILMGALALTALGGGLVAAQTTTKADDHAAHHPATSTPAPSPAKDGAGMGGMDMMGGGMGMGGGMMNGCPMGNGMSGGGMGMGGGGMGMGMLGPSAKIEVKKLPKGVTISITSDDAKVAARVFKIAEAMRLMHEANTQ